MIKRLTFYITYYWQRLTKPYLFKHYDDSVLGYGVTEIGKKLRKP